jgi:hypothetical protein
VTRMTPAFWKGDLATAPLVMLVWLLGSFGLVLIAGALAALITSSFEGELFGWGAAGVGAAALCYLGGRYVAGRADPAQPTFTTGAGEGESGGPSQWAVSPSE